MRYSNFKRQGWSVKRSVTGEGKAVKVSQGKAVHVSGGSQGKAVQVSGTATCRSVEVDENARSTASIRPSRSSTFASCHWRCELRVHPSPSHCSSVSIGPRRGCQQICDPACIWLSIRPWLPRQSCVMTFD